MSIDPQSNHYDAGGIETNAVIRAKLTPEQYQGWLLGNVLKYTTRMMHKHASPRRDCEKAAVYLGLLGEALKDEEWRVENSE